MREDLEHERDRSYAPTDLVLKHRKYRETERAKDRADYAVAQLQVERDVRSLVEELGTTRMEICRLHGDLFITHTE